MANPEGEKPSQRTIDAAFAAIAAEGLADLERTFPDVLQLGGRRFKTDLWAGGAYRRRIIGATNRALSTVQAGTTPSLVVATTLASETQRPDSEVRVGDPLIFKRDADIAGDGWILNKLALGGRRPAEYLLMPGQMVEGDLVGLEYTVGSVMRSGTMTQVEGVFAVLNDAMIFNPDGMASSGFLSVSVPLFDESLRPLVASELDI